jgi:hypothetical protein
MRAVTTLVAVLLAGCTTTRYVTPWLRTTVTAHPTVIAESGSGSTDALVVERRVDGKWVAIPEASDLAFAFAHGTRVLLKDTVVREDGSTVKLDCPGDIRGTRDGMHVLCASASDAPGTTPATLRVDLFDADGNAVRTRAPTTPFVLPRKPIEGPDVSYDLIGFVPEGIVFSVFMTDSHDSFALGLVKHSTAWLLRPDDTWRKLGTLAFSTSEFWKLHRAEPWNDQNHWTIDPGIMLQTHGGDRTYR